MTISALNEAGAPVDWWFAYKLPELPGSATGYEYLYIDSATDNVQKSEHMIYEGAVEHTIQSILKCTDSSLGYILYNDECPDGAGKEDNESYGHTKGVLAFDKSTNTGLWLLHSWPKYVDMWSADHQTPLSGQTFMCLTLDYDSMERLATQMINHQEPQVYAVKTVDTDSPLYHLSSGVKPTDPADSSILDLKTKGGVPFKVIAKNKKWGKDFWNDLVGPALGVDMDVESWIRGPVPVTEDSDGTHKVLDLKYIDLKPLGLPYKWPESKDHAKWGHSVDNDWICVGDINRMISQRNRGGGTIALQHPTLWKFLNAIGVLSVPNGVSVKEAKKIIKKTHNM